MEVRFLILVGSLAITACSDTIFPIQRADSALGDVTAEYVKVLYGGAAGGVTYCVNLSYADKMEECAVAAIHVDRAKLEWSERSLTFTHCGGEITNDETGIRRPVQTLPFKLSIVASCRT